MKELRMASKPIYFLPSVLPTSTTKRAVLRERTKPGVIFAVRPRSLILLPLSIAAMQTWQCAEVPFRWSRKDLAPCVRHTRRTGSFTGAIYLIGTLVPVRVAVTPPKYLTFLTVVIMAARIVPYANPVRHRVVRSLLIFVKRGPLSAALLQTRLVNLHRLSLQVRATMGCPYIP